MGGGITVWRGTAFNCAGNEITLRHNTFESGDAAGECNNRAIVGRGLHKVNDCYTSQLNISISMEMIGRSVECAYDDLSGSNPTLIGMDTITITTGIIFQSMYDEYE